MIIDYMCRCRHVCVKPGNLVAHLIIATDEYRLTVVSGRHCTYNEVIVPIVYPFDRTTAFFITSLLVYGHAHALNTLFPTTFSVPSSLGRTQRTELTKTLRSATVAYR